GTKRPSLKLKCNHEVTKSRRKVFSSSCFRVFVVAFVFTPVRASRTSRAGFSGPRRQTARRASYRRPALRRSVRCRRQIAGDGPSSRADAPVSTAESRLHGLTLI